MTTSRDYWRQREEENLRKNLKTEAEYARELNRIYTDAIDSIQKEIDAFYGRYATKEGITIAEAKKRVSKLDIEAYSRKAEKYVREKNFSKQANAEMRIYNLTMKVNRLEMLKAQIGLELVSSFDEIDRMLGEKLTERATEEFERQAGILGESVGDVSRAAASIVGASFYNATFSQRIWANQDALKSEISRLLQKGMIQGKHSDVLARELRKSFGTSRYESERLMRTEMARVQTQAQMQALDRYGIEEYEYMACPNGDMCAACKALDGKHFKTKDAMPGENAPPMHPNCHCATCAYLDEEKYSQWLDSYSDHGLSFREWREKNKNGKATFISKANMDESQLKSAEEIERMAKETDAIVGKHTSKPSKWSGRIDFLDGSEGYAAAKEWSCNISARLDIKEHQLIHEHLHARSISYYDKETYVKHQSMEELSIEMFSREICKETGIDIVYAEPYEGVKYLYEINSIAKVRKTDYEFAKNLFEVPITERANWLEQQIAKQIDNIGDFERAMKALGEVR